MARDRATRPEARPLRLFVAVTVPAAAEADVDAAVAPWRSTFPRARWVPSENRHVTLKFLGRTYPRLVGWVHERLAEAAGGLAPFTTRVAGLGCFPSPGRARVLWAGLDDAEGRWAALARAVDDALAREFEPERRAFAPHLTVARSEPPLRLSEDVAATSLGSDPFEVGEIVLFRSHLRRPAPVYEALGRFPLSG